MNKRITMILWAAFLALLALQCREADVASRNLSVAATQFELTRRIVFYNGITGNYMLTIEGRCSIEVQSSQRQLEVTCKVGPNKYKKHHLGLSHNVSYFSEQIGTANVSVYRYRVIFRPTVIAPYIDVATP